MLTPWKDGEVEGDGSHGLERRGGARGGVHGQPVHRKSESGGGCCASVCSAVLSEAIAAASEAAYAARQEGVPKLVVLEALRGASIASQGSLRQVEAALQAAGYDAKREIMQQSEVLRLQHRRIEEEMSLEHL